MWTKICLFDCKEKICLNLWLAERDNGVGKGTSTVWDARTLIVV